MQYRCTDSNYLCRYKRKKAEAKSLDRVGNKKIKINYKMKTLNLNAYGVSEMSLEEMQLVDGGGLKETLCAIGKALEAVGEALDSFGEWLQEVFCD
jgi:hypothetical protein